ncbi:hypothetical protein RMSM_03654 [Rhodopirellula maiorica SM1]|uniref:Uncharacterized protein n=1 Tax=Rhodopirellula maiorica SM1 TaxID=1265738 RepID=M5RVK2_9BACT|nr:hypothetical protein RMSM_03654 [Rhodopirellula maiorica SM1]
MPDPHIQSEHLAENAQIHFSPPQQRLGCDGRNGHPIGNAEKSDS